MSKEDIAGQLAVRIIGIKDGAVRLAIEVIENDLVIGGCCPELFLAPGQRLMLTDATLTMHNCERIGDMPEYLKALGAEIVREH